MIPILSEREVKKMKNGGQKLKKIMAEVLSTVGPGVTLRELDEMVEKRIEKLGGKPSFKMVPGYHWSACLNLNEGVVHGVPDDMPIKKGDLITVDIGFYSQGFHTDMARTVRAGEQENKRVKDKFLEAGEEALKKAIKQVKPGKRVGHLSQAIEQVIKKAGYSPIKSLTGHGVGRQLHQKPNIPCFLKGKIKETPLLKKGMVLAIEVIYAQGKPDLFVADDGWTIRTQDGKIAGLFEETVAVGADGPLVLTG
jgi:methionyl aminopeptidase